MFLSSLDRRVISDPSVDLVSLILWVVRLCLILSEVVCVPGHSVRSEWPGCLWYPLIIRVVLIDFIESDSIISGFSEAPSCLWSLLVSGFTEPLWGCLCPRLLGEVWVTQLLLVVTDYSDRTQWFSLLFTGFNLLLLFVFADLLSRQEFRRMQFAFSLIRSDLYLFLLYLSNKTCTHHFVYQIISTFLFYNYYFHNNAILMPQSDSLV